MSNLNSITRRKYSSDALFEAGSRKSQSSPAEPQFSFRRSRDSRFRSQLRNLQLGDLNTMGLNNIMLPFTSYNTPIWGVCKMDLSIFLFSNIEFREFMLKTYHSASSAARVFWQTSHLVFVQSCARPCRKLKRK